MHYWNNVIRLLRERQLSLRSLAREIGVSPTSLSNYSRGVVPSLDVAVKIARVLEVSLDSLLVEREESPPMICPAPEEHEFLHELVEELGVHELLALSRLGNQSPTWKLADVLASDYPAVFTVQELKECLDLDEPLLEACLLALTRRRLTEKVDGPNGPGYSWREPVAQFQAHESGDVALHMKRAVKIMLRDVLPAVDRRDGSGHLLTISARVSEEAAKHLSDTLNKMIKEEGRKCTARAGTTEVYVAFGVATR